MKPRRIRIGLPKWDTELFVLTTAVITTLFSVAFVIFFWKP